MIREQISKKYTNKDGVKIVTNYKDAVDWLHNDFILCNNIPDLDQTIYDNMRFDYFDDETGEPTEIYQWFLTSASQDDALYLEKRFGLLFTYSDLLDCYVLCVTHYGTAWDYVGCDDTEADEHFQNQIKKVV